ncbi:MAG: hypothetical protein JNL19_10130 [Burkholderiales bacterium]|nr:hypothetical protein [Burkholderiales bacterium]
MLEEVAEGTYDPLSDVLFYVEPTLVSVLSFGVLTILATRRLPLLTLKVALVSVLLALLLRTWFAPLIFDSHYPARMRLAFAVEMAIYTAASLAGFLHARYAAARQSSRLRNNTVGQ